MTAALCPTSRGKGSFATLLTARQGERGTAPNWPSETLPQRHLLGYSKDPSETRCCSQASV
jgi:hypothetical protein